MSFVRNCDLKSDYGDMNIFPRKKDAGVYLE